MTTWPEISEQSKEQIHVENNEKQTHDSFRCSNTKPLMNKLESLAAFAFSLSLPSLPLPLAHFPSGPTVFANLKGRGNAIQETIQGKR